MFLETSSPSKNGWTSYLTAAAKGKTAVSFYYHMHGATMGALSVEAQVGGTWKAVWRKQGQQQRNQGDKFRLAKVRQSCLTHPVSFLFHPPLSLQGAVQSARAPPSVADVYVDGVTKAKARAAPCSLSPARSHEMNVWLAWLAWHALSLCNSASQLHIAGQPAQRHDVCTLQGRRRKELHGGHGHRLGRVRDNRSARSPGIVAYVCLGSCCDSPFAQWE